MGSSRNGLIAKTVISFLYSTKNIDLTERIFLHNVSKKKCKNVTVKNKILLLRRIVGDPDPWFSSGSHDHRERSTSFSMVMTQVLTKEYHLIFIWEDENKKNSVPLLPP